MNLNSEQLAVIQSRAPNKAVLAGAGSGKTSALVGCIHDLIAEGVPAKDIACVTFTNVAADEMRKRIGTDHKIGYIGTVHSLMLKGLRQFGTAIGLPRRLTVLSEQARADFLQEAVVRYKARFTFDAIDDEMKKGPGRFFKPSTQQRTQIEIVAANIYGDMLHSGILTQDALLQFGIEIIRQCPEAFPFKYLFWDEFQDTGNDDAQIFREIRIPNKMVVGDPRQSIYGFRKANVKNFMELIGDPKFKQFTLETNYRCAHKITDSANCLMAFASDVFPKMRAENDCVGRIEVNQHENDKLEVAQIIEIIKESRREGLPDNEVAVIVRTNPVRENITKALERAGYPVSRSKPEKPPADIMACLAFLSDPENTFASENFLKYWCRPNRKSFPEMRNAAKKSGQTVNEKYFQTPLDITPPQVTPAMVRLGFDQEAIYFVNRAVEKLQDGATVADLILSMYDTTEEKQNGIVVTTFHGAKGREFEVVILAAFEDEEIPAKREDLEEERRIAYVGITRAKNRLVISHTKSRWNFGTKDATPSRFIYETQLA